jgi:hypothetical protein
MSEARGKSCAKNKYRSSARNFAGEAAHSSCKKDPSTAQISTISFHGFPSTNDISQFKKSSKSFLQYKKAKDTPYSRSYTVK